MSAIPAQTLQGQVAVITGAGRGIGSAIAGTLAKLGASVVLCARTEEQLHRIAANIAYSGGVAHPVACDVTDLDSVNALAKTVVERYGRVDILVNNAGVMSASQPLHQMAPEEWERILNTNLRGAFYTLRAFTPMMIAARRGDIVNISSVAGKNPLPNNAAYAASKWALNGLSYSAAEELRPYGIRVSVVCPASTETTLSAHPGKDPAKMLQPDDVAQVVAMLVTQHPRSFVSEVVLRPTQKP